MPITADTRIVALLGSPVSHSLSPVIHNAAFEAAGLNLRYVAFDVSAESLEEAVNGLRSLGAVGANVTIPLKRDVARFVDALSPVARETGAVNTLVFRSGIGGPVRIEADNTDVAGFLRALELHRDTLTGKPVLVLGSGGSARAVIFGLARQHAPNSITVAARSRESAAGLVRQFAKRGIDIDAIGFAQASEAAGHVALVVNATPVGMYPNVERSPLPPGTLGRGQIVYDLVYNPVETLLLKQSRDAGATVIGGTDMLLAQAAESFLLWTGVDMPAAAARNALNDAIQQQHR